MDTDRTERTGTAAGGPAGSPDTGRVTRNDIIRRVVILVAIVGSLVGLFFTGRAAQTGLGSTSAALPANVDRLIPASGAEVPRQSQVGIDVADGYDAYLIINGTEVRGEADGLIRDLGTGLVLFQPGDGKVLEGLNGGRNCIVAMVWKQLDGPTTAAPVSWCFDAT